jgi:hypothetical protein
MIRAISMPCLFILATFYFVGEWESCVWLNAALVSQWESTNLAA